MKKLTVEQELEMYEGMDEATDLYMEIKEKTDDEVEIILQLVDLIGKEIGKMDAYTYGMMKELRHHIKCTAISLKGYKEAMNV